MESLLSTLLDDTIWSSLRMDNEWLTVFRNYAFNRGVKCPRGSQMGRIQISVSIRMRLRNIGTESLKEQHFTTQELQWALHLQGKLGYLKWVVLGIRRVAGRWNSRIPCILANFVMNSHYLLAYIFSKLILNAKIGIETIMKFDYFWKFLKETLLPIWGLPVYHFFH